METIYIFARFLHISAGVTAFFVAPVALIAKKGGETHILWGKILFWAMIAVAFTAIPMTIYHPNLFLFLVAAFSVHLSLSGYRAASARKSEDLFMNRIIDKTFAFVSLAVYMCLIGWGVYNIIVPDNPSFGYISLIFGILGIRLSLNQLSTIYSPATSVGNMDWWFKHMKGMIGAYIATISAFSAVNFYFLPPLVRWLWPTVIGGVGLYIWEVYYKKKFNTAHAQSLAKI